MDLDAFSISAIIVTILTVVAIFILILRSNRQGHEKRERIAEYAAKMSRHHGVREYCKTLQKMYPDACPGLDYIITQDELDNPYIEVWLLDVPKPSDVEIKQQMENQ
ncbi:XkdW family protein [Candidatus Venteria ishoeyi]|uniref:XkdW protein n=1 Tax=Candidatus Venteria ishoeyi TaxID=1899563 RepID=A0A1H6FBK6_9GAMM|nr:XkdW family protein [Candidatus Venteria ishoeyi]MDM8545035.1 XkdW family protein [Candidatus Venteria ishoeyi]SEH07023.1 XkdW protein [Candidatus Venteria ishoeyi]